MSILAEKISRPPSLAQDMTEMLQDDKSNIVPGTLTTERLSKDFMVCLMEGGAYSLADSIATLEAYSAAFHLDDARQEMLGELLGNIESAQGTDQLFIAKCEVVSALLCMQLNGEGASIHLAIKLFSSVGYLAEQIYKEENGRRVPANVFEVAGMIVRHGLELACNSEESTQNVILFGETLREESEGAADNESARFLKHFVRNGRAHFPSF